METDRQRAQAQTIATTNTNAGTQRVVGATSNSAQLSAPQVAVASSLSNEVDRARMLLVATAGDPARRIEVVRRILETAVRADATTAAQLFNLVAAIQDPQVQQVLQNARNTHRATTAATTTPVTASTSVATTSTTGGTSGVRGAQGASTPGVTWGTPDPEHAPPPPYISKDPAIAKKQADLRSKEYKEDAARDGYLPATGVDVTLAARYKEIRLQKPSLPHEYVVLMVGQSHQEQTLHCINMNFMGMEGMVYGEPWLEKKLWTRGLTSIAVPVLEVQNHRERYLNWPGNPDVEVQLAHPPHDGKINCMIYAPRPAYRNLTDAVAAFIAAIELRRNALAAQGSPIATSVLTGDVEAYIDMVHKPAGQIKPYNDRPSYPADVRAGVAAAKAQIGDGKTI